MAKTALLATQGFPDTLLYRHGGKREPLNLAMEFPPPYIPRRLTFEIPERINAEGGVERALDEAAARTVIEACRASAWTRSPSPCSGRSSTRRMSCASAR